MANNKVNVLNVKSMIIKINYLGMVSLHQCFNWVSPPSLFRGAIDCAQ